MDDLPRSIFLQRLPEVLRQRQCGATKHYEDIAAGLWVPGVQLGRRAVAWPAQEVEVLQAAYVAGNSPDDIRALVRELVANRATAFQSARSRYLTPPKSARGSRSVAS